jgi:hypothetical protein
MAQIMALLWGKEAKKPQWSTAETTARRPEFVREATLPSAA